MTSKMEIENQKIDESLYSRQLYVLGHEAMKKMSSSNILIMGLKGLGVEIAKNIILAGVKSVTLYDPSPVEIADLSAQFYLKESDIGKSRQSACSLRLAELNQYVQVQEFSGNFSTSDLSRFNVVVLTDTPLNKQLEINDYTHSNGIKFISTEIRGLFGMCFCDFGEEFLVSDPTGENPLSGMVAAIDKDYDGVVTCLDESRHGLEDGDYVTFKEVQGMTELNDCEPRQIKVLGPYTFSIGDTSNFGDYSSGGTFIQVKRPKTYHFQSLREALKKPEYLISDFAKFDRPMQLHIAFQALSEFSVNHSGEFPSLRNEDHAIEFFKLSEKISQQYEDKVELDEKLIKEFSYQARGYLSPMAALFGGFVGQEILKACSGKFQPVYQYMYFDSLESLPKNSPLSEQSVQPAGSRYDAQIAVFGKEFQEKIANFREFMVGAGAIGCEMLKNWAMMGLGTGPRGRIHITDMDTIERSNLNRQFLFRSADVGHPKSRTATNAIIDMNPDLKDKIIAYNDRVGPNTEHIFNDEFFESIDGVTNALDNVEARQYVDRRCVFFRKSLLESGTLGTKGNTQVVIPFMTESYSSSRDPPEKSIPICTLKNFPNAIEHTIQWARDLFEGLFKQPAEHVNSYLSRPNYLQDILKQMSADHKQTLEIIRDYLVLSKPLRFEQCVAWARFKFESYYNNDIRQLLHNFPKDSVTSSGTPFWSGPKRAPNPLTFDPNNDTHMDFIEAAAKLHAFNYGLKGDYSREKIKEILSTVMVPEFTPKSGVRIQVNDSEPLPQQSVNQSELKELAEQIPPASSLAGYRMIPCEFEKDDDTNYHIDFIAAASNLRAINYGIEPTDRHNTKFIAGKIIPAIATTTALITGLVCLELYKIIDGKDKIEDYKNGFINLALPFFGFSEPIKMPIMKYHDVEWSLWDRFDIPNDITLQEFIDYFQKQHNLEVTMISSGVMLLYSSFMPSKKSEDRKKLKLSELIETVSKKPLPSHLKSLVFEICANDHEGEDVEVPYVRVQIRP